MQHDRRKGLSPWARNWAYASRQGFTGLQRGAIVLGLIVLVFLLGALLGALDARAAEQGTIRMDRLGADGTCTFTGPIEQRITHAHCLTGLYFGQPIAAQVETGDAYLAGWIVTNTPGLLSVALVNLAFDPLPNSRVVVRVSLAVPAPQHPCDRPPTAGLPTPRDRCIAEACAAGREPICLVKTSAPGTGMPGAD